MTAGREPKYTLYIRKEGSKLVRSSLYELQIPANGRHARLCSERPDFPPSIFITQSGLFELTHTCANKERAKRTVVRGRNSVTAWIYSCVSDPEETRPTHACAFAIKGRVAIDRNFTLVPESCCLSGWLTPAECVASPGRLVTKPVTRALAKETKGLCAGRFLGKSRGMTSKRDGGSSTNLLYSLLLDGKTYKVILRDAIFAYFFSRPSTPTTTTTMTT